MRTCPRFWLTHFQHVCRRPVIPFTAFRWAYMPCGNRQPCQRFRRMATTQQRPGTWTGRVAAGSRAGRCTEELMPGSVEARKGRTRTPRGPMRQLKWFASSWARLGAGLSSTHRPSANAESDARARPVPRPGNPSPPAGLPRTSAHRLGAARRASSNLVPRVRRIWKPHLAACPQTQLPPDALRSKPLKARTPCVAPPKTC